MRRQHDAYYTEQGLVLELLKYLSLDRYKTIIKMQHTHLIGYITIKYIQMVFLSRTNLNIGTVASLISPTMYKTLYYLWCGSM